MDQSSAQQNDIMYGTNMHIKTEDGQNMVILFVYYQVE